MESPTKERDATGLRFTSGLVDGSFARGLAKTEEGRRRVVICADSEPMDLVVDRLEAGPLPATLCVETGPTGMVVAHYRNVTKHGHGESDVHHVAPSSTVGVFLSYLVARGKAVTFCLTEPEQTAFELSYEDDEDCLPV